MTEDKSQSQSLLLTQPQGTLEEGRLAGGWSDDDEDGHGDEGEKASQASSSQHPRHNKRAIPPATATSGQTRSEHEQEEGQEGGPHPPKKISRVSDSLSAAQEQKLVELFALNLLFYDQTLCEFKDKAKHGHLLGVIGNDIGLTGKSGFLIKSINIFSTLSCIKNI